MGRSSEHITNGDTINEKWKNALGDVNDKIFAPDPINGVS